MPLLRSTVRRVQTRLRELGYSPGPADGILGPRTTAAVREFQANERLTRQAGGTIRWPGTIGPTTLAALGITSGPPTVPDAPWMEEARRKLGLHERRNNRTLRRFLRLDGHTLGDPARLPWCGDFVETCIRLALPTEPIPQNPYWARNWLRFGRMSEPLPGAIVVFRRGSGGHVGFVEGMSSDGKYVHTLGGNQSNSVTISKMRTDRVLGYRWPITAPMTHAELATIEGGEISDNEA